VINSKQSYQQIFKATSVFGGVQFINIVLAVFRSKFVALLLGPSGMGLFSLFTSTIGLVSSLTNFGLGISAVKNVASAAHKGDDIYLSKVVGVFRRLVWITGCLGFLITFILAPLLSQLAFKNNAFSIAFMCLSITLLITQISAGQNVVLQGLRKIQFLAKANVFGSFLGLITSIPLYYFFGTKGIVPAIIVSSFCTLALSWFYASKVIIRKVRISKDLFKTESKMMLKMGFLISMSGLFNLATSYAERIFISNIGGLKDVGLFAAGFAIISTYVGMIFTAMSTDYYPRLSTVAHDNLECSKSVNQQAEIALLILAPILTIFLVFVKLAVVILYSKSFLGIISMVQWATLGIYLKALGWSVGFIFLAKGSTKVFFWNEVVFNTYLMLLNMTGYYFFGLTGLGASFLFAYIFYVVQVYLVSRKLYRFSFERNTFRIFLVQFSLAILCFLSVWFLDQIVAYTVGGILIFVSAIYSWVELNKRIGIKQFVLLKITRKK
jgi:O-antigen/teichoic acid export membrane protein